jgi:hypothetical protein
MAVMAGLDYNGVCASSQRCSFNNVCPHPHKEIAFYLMWMLPCAVLFLVSLFFTIKTWIFLRRANPDDFNTNQILAMTIHRIPLWSFIIYSIDLAISAVPRSQGTGFGQIALDLLESIPFMMPLPIGIAMLRYRNYFLNRVLIGESL